MLGAFDAAEKLQDLLWAQNYRQFLRLLGSRNDVVKLPVPFQRDLVEKAQCATAMSTELGANFLSLVRWTW